MSRTGSRTADDSRGDGSADVGMGEEAGVGVDEEAGVEAVEVDEGGRTHGATATAHHTRLTGMLDYD